MDFLGRADKNRSREGTYDSSKASCSRDAIARTIEEEGSETVCPSGRTLHEHYPPVPGARLFKCAPSRQVRDLFAARLSGGSPETQWRRQTGRHTSGD